MDKNNLQTLRCAPDIQQSSQLQFELLQGAAPKPNQHNAKAPMLSLNQAMEEVRQLRHNHQIRHNFQIPRQTMISNQQRLYQQEFLKHQHMRKSMQQQRFQPIPTSSQTKMIIHPPTSHQNGSQQFHLVQVQVPGKETQLQLIPFQTKSNTTNPEPRRYNRLVDTVNVSHEYVSQNQDTNQTIYPSFYGPSHTSQLSLLKNLPCPPLAPLASKTPPLSTSKLVEIQETSQLLPLQGISMPKESQFHQQISNVVNVPPSQNISLEEIDIKPDIIDELLLPSEFLKSILSDPEDPKQKQKRKRKLKSFEMFVDNDGVDDDESHDYVEKKKHRKMSDEEKAVKKAKRIDKMYQKQIRPCSVQLKRLMISYDDMPVKIVNDKTVKIGMPRMKSVATNYNKISNIGYIKYPKGIAYKCLSQTCRFQSYDEEVFEKHLMNHHSEDAISEWVGYCCSCNDFITAKTLIDEFDHLIEFHLQTTKKVHRETQNSKNVQNTEQLDAEAILAIKEVLDAFEEIVAEVDGVDDEASVDVPSVSSEDETVIFESKKITESIEDKIKSRIDEEAKSNPEEPVKEPATIAGRLRMNRRKTVDSREPPPRRSSRHSTSIEYEEKEECDYQLPSVIVNSSNDGKIKMTIKNPIKYKSFHKNDHKKKKVKKVAKNTFHDPLTPPESSSNCTDSDYSEPSNIDC